MNFEDAFKHYQDGCATDEEKKYVKEQLDKAKAFSGLFDDEGINVTPAPIAEADKKQIKIAKKQFKWKYVIVPICIIACVLVVLTAILGGVFGAASIYASQNIVYDKNKCINFAKEYAYDFLTSPNNPFEAVLVTSIKDLIVDDVDTNFEYDGDDIKKSYYTFRVEIDVSDYTLVIDVDSRFANDCNLLEID